MYVGQRLKEHHLHYDENLTSTGVNHAFHGLLMNIEPSQNVCRGE